MRRRVGLLIRRAARQ